MRVLLAFILVITVVGVGLLGWMMARDNRRLGMTGLGVLMAAEVMAMVYAAMDHQ